MPASQPQLDHLAFPIFEVEASLRFYTEVLQLPLVAAHSGDDWGGKPWLMMIFGLADDRQLALCALRGVKRPPADGLPKDLRHVALSAASAEDLAAWRKRLTAHAIDFSEEDHGIQRSLYFEDPNGIVLEVTAPPTPSQTLVADRSAGQTVAEWLRGR